MNLRRFFTVFVFAGLALSAILCAALVAQDKKPDDTASKKEDVSIVGDLYSRRYPSKDVEVHTLTGNVVVKHEDTTFTSDHAVYTYDKKKNTKTVVADGSVKIVDPKDEITGTKVIVYLNDRKTVIEGNVKLVAQPKSGDTTEKPSAAIAKLKEPATVTCDKLEYLYRKKIATFSGNLKVVSGGRTFVGQQAVYDLDKELVTITGDAKGTDEEGQVFTSSGTMRVSLKEGDEWIESEKVTATIKVDVDKETSQEKTPETPAEKK